MDLTLRDYLHQTQTLHDEVQLKGIGMKPQEIEDAIKKLKTYIKNIQAVAKYMADVSNSISQSASMVRKINPVNFETYPTSTDHVCLRLSSKDMIREVDYPDQVPITKLFYIRSLKQYAINIGGILVKGNLADISDGKITKKTFLCRKGAKCTELQNDMCPFYHDPEHYIENKLPVKCERILSNTSWIYDPDSKKSTRKIGGKSTIRADMLRVKSLREEISTREFQLIHDLLVLLQITEYGLNTRYQFWDVNFGLKK